MRACVGLRVWCACVVCVCVCVCARVHACACAREGRNRTLPSRRRDRAVTFRITNASFVSLIYPSLRGFNLLGRL